MAQVLSGMAGAVSIAPWQKGSVLLARMVMVAKDLSAAKETDPTVSMLSEPCVSQVSSPEWSKQAKARQNTALNILWLCCEGQTIGRHKGVDKGGGG